ncbi:MAG: sigma-70 family RNA polymerase sigma factor [Phycisphaerales bacterium]|nr:sigma-70 family RNA polymerase sigma factor [Phycisphaerales bacterium]
MAVSTVPDIELMALIATGGQDAFAAFYDRHSARVFGLLLRILGNSGDAEDVLQDVFWQVWSRAEQYDQDRGTPLAWLVLIARSRALDRRRRLMREPNPVEETPEVPQDADAAADVELAEGVLKARNALSQLPTEQQEAIQLAFFNGLSHSEIAERTKLPLGTVKTRIRSGITKLRDLLNASKKGSDVD